jgi:predicted permease
LIPSTDLGSKLDALARDNRHALRRLRRDWIFSAASVLVLGVGIGANTAIFSVINAALFRAPLWAATDRLVDIYQNGSNPGALDGNSYPAYLDIAEYSDVFAGTTAASVPLGVTYQSEGGVRPAVAEHTTASYASVLGLRPSVGRWFTPAEDKPNVAIVAVLGHQAWMRKFGGDPSVVGRTIRIEGAPVTIVGVGPAGYDGTLNVGIVTDFYLPIGALAALVPPAHVLERRPQEAVFVVKARLRDGVSVAGAQAAMRILGARLAREYPDEDPGKGISVFPTRDVRIHPQLDAALRWFAFVLLAVVSLVLAVACSNLATLVLVRGAARAKEVSIRVALGATRGDVVRQLLTESVLLAGAGGVAGLLLTWWTLAIVGALDLPLTVNVTVDYRVLGFAVALSCVTGIALGLAPALASTRLDLVPALRDDTEARSSDGRRFALKNALVVFQVAVSVVLLAATGVFLQMLGASRSREVGFATERIAMIQTDARYAYESPVESRRKMEEIRRRIAEIPGVQSAVLSRGLPMQVSGVRVTTDQGRGGRAGPAGAIWAGPGFFEMLDIPILHGRSVDDRDRLNTPRVAVISEAMAREYFGGAANAVGRSFRLEHDADTVFEVVGVARNTGTADLSGDLVDPTPHLFFRSFAQSDLMADTVLARQSVDVGGLVAAMERQLRATDPALPVISARTMQQHLDESLLVPKAAITLFGGLGTLGLGLAGVGLYALVAFRVARRSREIGIRMALGARRAQVVWTVTREVTILVAVGIVAGLVTSCLGVLALRAVAAPAPGVSLYRPSLDPVALFAIATFMAALGAAAASMPAWRAATMDPVRALHRE